MTDRFAYTLLKSDGGARLGEIATPRGVIRTPAFMPVGTAATVKALYTDQLVAAGTDIVLVLGKDFTGLGSTATTGAPEAPTTTVSPEAACV